MTLVAADLTLPLTMCGICGYANLSDTPSARPCLEAMSATLRHRGPDGSGVWLDSSAGVGLGHNRLAVIDLAGGAQPMASFDGRYVVVFNGEIYNFRALRHELESHGHPFRTNSDTEVLLEAYRRWGRECALHLHGMFAFALYDSLTRLLFLARDRTGVKPLYYYDGPEGFFFASEIKAILAWHNIPRYVNYRALVDFFRLGYPLTPNTLFEAIKELEAGTWLEISPKGRKRGRFWEWKRTPASWQEDEALDRTEESLLESLKEHLVADVPIGAFLSGGIDSSLAVALLTKELHVHVETFNVRFAESRYDESAYARAVAEHLSTNHHEIVIDQPGCGRNRPMDMIDRVQLHFDQPFIDSSAIPTFLICREIRKFVKVAISGDGGDEMFGGYSGFWYADLAKRLGALPAWSLRALSRASAPLRKIAPDRYREGQKFLRAAYPPATRLLALYSYVAQTELPRMVQRMVLERAEDYEPRFSLNGHGGGPDGADLIDSIIRYTLPGDYLRKVDMMSSAHGLEVRVPFLGEPVLDCAARLPHSLRYRGRRNKLLLRRLAARYLPASVVEKPKWGFGIPLDTWVGREGREAIRIRLGPRNARIHALLRPEYTSHLLDCFVTQQWDRSTLSRFGLYQRVYGLLSLERWLEAWNPAL